MLNENSRQSYTQDTQDNIKLTGFSTYVILMQIMVYADHANINTFYWLILF